jgi:hypothetical protein
MLTGSRFQGISQASGGNFQDSSTNYPVVQLRAIDNSQVAFLPVDPIAGWSDTAFTSTPVNNFPPGPALVTVFTNGIPSDSKYLVVATLTSVVSRKTHTGVDDFDIDLPFTGPGGVECRSGGPNNEYTLIFTFSAPVTDCGTASLGVASSGPGTNQCTVNLSGLTNAQYYQVNLNGVDGAADVPGPQWGLLLGDVTGNGAVSNGAVSNTDVATVKAQVAAPVTSANFRSDINANGVISNTDVSVTKGQVGTTLP